MDEQRQLLLQLLLGLADSLELTDLQLDAHDSVQIILDGNVPINLFWREEVQHLVTFAVVGYADDQLENREELLQDILNAQFFWTKLKGFTLALEPDTDLLVLMDKRQPSFFADEYALQTYLETFSEVVQEWRQKLSEHAGEIALDSSEKTAEPESAERFAALLGNWLQA